ncbi:ArnT family glycosyltransferase [Roseateles sp. BYS78W]|uniref:ArnT family glycosyltransferase n=1 Tax=Pelomonas candidula TaxID=3299025 RepID=A0ABW7HJH8_9BURK
MELHVNPAAEGLSAPAPGRAWPMTRPQLAICGLLALLLVLRLAAMAGLPLMDTTEARYGEIGRKMMVFDDWVTPWFDIGVPFWGKPPMSFWATAASMRLLGISEFAARLPHLLCGGGIALLVWQFARRRGDAREALLAVALLGGAALFFVSVGAVMTDTVMVLCTTAALCSFWFALHAADEARRRRHGWMFFIALGMGLLAKGPVAVVLAGLPVVLWTMLQRRVGDTWRALPWLRGSLLALALAAPWYLLAEQRTPGFINYFIVGEHWHRFFTPGWSGDRYGHAHQMPIGSIWVFAWGALLPWSLLVPLAAWRWRRVRVADEQASLRLYLWLWALLPLLFFTAARNIIWTYALPSLPAVALLMARWLVLRSAHAEAWVAAGLAAALLGGVVGLGRLGLDRHQDQRSARHLVQAYLAEAKAGEPLLYLAQRPYSAAFYSQGRALQIPGLAALPAALGQQAGYVALESKLDMTQDLQDIGLQLEHRVCCFGDEQLLRVRAKAP